MTRKEFNSYLDKLTSETGFDLTKEQKAFAYQAAQEYQKRFLRKNQFYCFDEEALWAESRCKVECDICKNKCHQ